MCVLPVRLRSGSTSKVCGILFSVIDVKEYWSPQPSVFLTEAKIFFTLYSWLTDRVWIEWSFEQTSGWNGMYLDRARCRIRTARHAPDGSIR